MLSLKICRLKDYFSDSGTFNTLFLISDIWFLTDILLNLRTGVVLDDVEMEVVFDPVEIRKYYMKSWFFIGTVQTIISIPIT